MRKFVENIFFFAFVYHLSEITLIISYWYFVTFGQIIEFFKSFILYTHVLHLLTYINWIYIYIVLMLVVVTVMI